MIDEITVATTERSTGLSQVNQALSQLDHSTQQNAALVEQSAAAEEQLREQAAKLAQAVGEFKLARGMNEGWRKLLSGMPRKWFDLRDRLLLRLPQIPLRLHADPHLGRRA